MYRVHYPSLPGVAVEPVADQRAGVSSMLVVAAVGCVPAALLGLGAGYLLGGPAGVVVALSVAGLFGWIYAAEDLLHLGVGAVQAGVSVFLFGGSTLALAVALHSGMALVIGAVFTALSAAWGAGTAGSPGDESGGGDL
jgi:hypothetical protein